MAQPISRGEPVVAPGLRIDDAAEKAIYDDIKETGSRDGSSVGLPHEKQPWWTIFWDYDPTRTKEERKFVHKLDTYLLTLLALGYFIKGLDQANIGAAYISGMKEDLKLQKNELNYIDISWTIGYVVGMIPSQLILTKVRPRYWIPAAELVWTFLTFMLVFAKTANAVIGIRFVIGLAESTFYPAVHLVLGSWYKPAELGKRAGIIYAVGSAAGMFTGYLQIAAYKGLNGHLGHKGWQWLFIIDGIISLPVALAGFWLYPDYPSNTKAFYLNEKDRAFAVKRMEDIGRAPYRKFSWKTLKKLFFGWEFYVFSIVYIIFSNNGSSNSVNPLTLWKKAEGWSVTSLNLLPTGQAGVQVVASLAFAFISDFMQNRPIPLSIAAFIGLFNAIVLAVWDIPSGLKWFAMFAYRAAIPYGPLVLTYLNEVVGGDAEVRAVLIGSMNALGYAFNCFLPLFTYPTVDAPRFHVGWRWSIAAFALQILGAWIIYGLHSRDKGKKFFRKQVVRGA